MPLRATLHHRDCLAALAMLPDASVDAVITDPPYFLDKMANEWDRETLAKVTSNSQVSSLPAGMKFDPQQGRDFQAFMFEVSEQVLRVLKPGGFYLAFSAPRLAHRLGVAMEDAGFHIRDLWAWLYTQNQVKAMSVARFLERYPDLDEEQRAALVEELAVWKTPQIKSCLEPIVCGQKPPEGTFLENWMTHRVGLVNTAAKVGAEGNMFPANLLQTEQLAEPLDGAFLVPKPRKQEKGDFNSHKSVKPLALMTQLVRLVCPPGATVLDPFNGSGSTGLAALLEGCSYIGVELDEAYVNITKRRFDELFGEHGFAWTLDAQNPQQQYGELQES